MLDSGATYSYLPRDIVLPFVRQFSPPVGRFGGRYWASCNATIPKFGVTIGGEDFLPNNLTSSSRRSARSRTTMARPSRSA